MRKSIRKAISETLQDMLNAGFGTSFTEKELNKFGVKIPTISLAPKRIKRIRKKTNLSQNVFARLLNVSSSSIRQWEQGKRRPTGSTKVLLDILDKKPHILDYRLQTSSLKKSKAA